MKTSADLRFLKEQLSTWATAQAGTCEIAMNLAHLFALLSIKPGGFRVAVDWKGEEKRGEYEEAGMVDAKFWIALSFGNSMLLNKQEAWVKGAGGSDPWADIVENCRDFVRGLSFDPQTTEQGPNYLGSHPLVEIHEDFLLDGWYLEFQIGKLLPLAAPGGAVQGQSSQAS